MRQDIFPITIIDRPEGSRIGAPSETELVLRAPDSGPAIPWKLHRLLVAALSEIRGAGSVRGLLRPRQAELSLVLRRLVDDLDGDQRRIRSVHSALELGSLPARFLNPARLRHAWVDLLAELLEGRSTTVIIDNVYSVDAESVFLIRLLVGRIADGSLRFVLGHDPKPGGVGGQDLIEGLLRDVIDRVMTGLEALPQSRAIDRDRCLAETGSESPAQEVLLEGYHELDDVSEWAALTATGERKGSSSANRDLVFRGLRDSFECFGFGSAARIGTSLLDQGAQEEILGEVHRLTALSLYNQYFFTGYSAGPLGLKIAQHLSAALARERSAARRAALEYSLCIVHGRVLRDFATALRHADRSLRFAGADEVPPGLTEYLEAWARNGRAYALFRQGRNELAEQECQRAVELLRSAPAHPDVPRVVVLASQADVLDNLVKLSDAAGDREKSRYWQRRQALVGKSLPWVIRPARSWLIFDVYCEDLRLEAAAIREQLQRTRLQLDLEDEAFCAHALASMHFRLGEASEANSLFRRALECWHTVGGMEDDLLTTELNCAVTAFWSGQLGPAEAGFQRALQHQRCQGTEIEAELLSALAMVAAKAGELERAEARGRRAIDLAYQLGGPDSRVRVHRSIAEAYILSDDLASARKQLDDAVSLIAESPRNAVPPEDLLGVTVARLACGAGSRESIEQAVDLVPAALEDLNAWWELPRLAPAVLASLKEGRPELRSKDRDPFSPLRCLVVAAIQRADCQGPATQLKQLIDGHGSERHRSPGRRSRYRARKADLERGVVEVDG